MEFEQSFALVLAVFLLLAAGVMAGVGSRMRPVSDAEGRDSGRGSWGWRSADAGPGAGGGGVTSRSGKERVKRHTWKQRRAAAATRRELDVGMLCAEVATRLESGASLNSAWQDSLERVFPGLNLSQVRDFVKGEDADKEGNPLYGLKHRRDVASALRGVLVATEVSTQVGAPLAQILNRVADGISDTMEAAAKRHAAQVGPRASAKLLGVLPIAALGMASLVGVDVVDFATSGGLNTVLIVVGVVLMAAGNLWSVWMIRRAEGMLPRGLDPTLAMDIIAACQQNGISLTATLKAVSQASEESDLSVVAQMLLLGASWEEAWAEADTKWQGLKAVLQPAWEQGASPVPLLLRGASRTRKRHTQAAIEAAEKLGVRLVVPLGVCLLPAFFVLGIVPVVVSTVQDLIS